ncbi:hypothetical protein FKP32DRAFT_458525 [Trametes sanguinea]|nr:hypothetical protein FKP32DRAFT_458525 [Trametes sanguinea]
MNHQKPQQASVRNSAGPALSPSPPPSTPPSSVTSPILMSLSVSTSSRWPCPLTGLVDVDITRRLRSYVPCGICDTRRWRTARNELYGCARSLRSRQDAEILSRLSNGPLKHVSTAPCPTSSAIGGWHLPFRPVACADTTDVLKPKVRIGKRGTS